MYCFYISMGCSILISTLANFLSQFSEVTKHLLSKQMHQQSILKTDELITRFFRLCTEMCVDLCYRALSEQTHNPTLVRAKCFHTLDAYVRLIALLVKHSGDTANTITKINLLNKVNCSFIYIFMAILIDLKGVLCLFFLLLPLLIYVHYKMFP